MKRLVEEGLSAYSLLAAGRPGASSEGWIYVQYEYGEDRTQYVGGHIDCFSLSWVLEGEPTGDGRLPDWLGN